MFTNAGQNVSIIAIVIEETIMCKLIHLFFAVGIGLLTVTISIGQPPASPEADKARQILEKGLSDSNPDKRKEAVIALSLEEATSEVLLQLETALDDKDVL